MRCCAGSSYVHGDGAPRREPGSRDGADPSCRVAGSVLIAGRDARFAGWSRSVGSGGGLLVDAVSFVVVGGGRERSCLGRVDTDRLEESGDDVGDEAVPRVAR